MILIFTHLNVKYMHACIMNTIWIHSVSLEMKKEDSDSLKLPKEFSQKLRLKEGMELKVLSDEVDGILILKIVKGKKQGF